jgi:hypothetical protein
MVRLAGSLLEAPAKVLEKSLDPFSAHGVTDQVCLIKG